MKIFVQYKKYKTLRLLAKAQKLAWNDKSVKAIRAYNQALELIDKSDKRRHANIHEKIGDIYANLDLIEDACDSYICAVEREPNSYCFHFTLAVFYSRLHDNKNARESFRHAYWLASQDIGQLRSGAETLKEIGFADLQENWLERAYRVEQKNSWRES